MTTPQGQSQHEQSEEFVFVGLFDDHDDGALRIAMVRALSCCPLYTDPLDARIVLTSPSFLSSTLQIMEQKKMEEAAKSDPSTSSHGSQSRSSTRTTTDPPPTRQPNPPQEPTKSSSSRSRRPRRIRSKL